MIKIHDARCEAHWNHGVCACAERAENATARPWPPLKKSPSLLTRLLRLH